MNINITLKYDGQTMDYMCPNGTTPQNIAGNSTVRGRLNIPATATPQVNGVFSTAP